MNAPDLKFGKNKRLRRKAEIDAVFAESVKVSNGGLAMRYRESDKEVSRIALTTGRRWGNAVERNRIRRIAKEVFRKWQCPESFVVDIVFTQYRILSGLPGSQIASLFENLLKSVRKR